jgi:hypothetical protein
MDGRSESIGSTVFRVIVSSFAAPVYGSLASAGATPQAIDGNKILGCERQPGRLRAPAAAGPNEPIGVRTVRAVQDTPNEANLPSARLGAPDRRLNARFTKRTQCGVHAEEK